MSLDTPDRVELALRLGLGVLIGAVLGLVVAFGLLGTRLFAIPITVGGIIVCAYLGYRYGDRFFSWILKWWNQPADY